MSDTWGNLEESERRYIAETSRRLSDREIDERFVQDGDQIKFRVTRRTDRSLAGPLDIDADGEEEVPPGLPGIAPETDDEPTDEELLEHEVVEFTLISPDDFEYEPEITDDDRRAASAIDESVSELQDFYSRDSVAPDRSNLDAEAADAAGLPAVIDHRNRQSPVKDQAGRGTCVSHASMGMLEAFDHIPDDLSEQYTHYKFNEFLNRPHNRDSGLRTTDAAPFLARGDGRVCLEAQWPYIPAQATIDALVAANTYGPPQGAQNNQDFGYGSYKIITDKGLTGESIKNTRYLEALVYKGYDVVFGTYVSWDDNNNDGILEPVLDPSGAPVRKAGHAMVIVGYNRTSQYFIVKNSWGAGWGHSGYGYLHYNLVRSCFKYGFVVDSVVPAAPSLVPNKLANAPYNTQKISRSALRAAVLFIKTSSGRYAVCEAYAGYNLHLRHLRVYNADGTTHLEKDSLIIRGTYLCDIDSGLETSSDADFWWEAVRPGVNYLVPRNGAAAAIAFDLAGFTPAMIDGVTLDSAPVPSADLHYAVVVGRTTANRRFKLLAHARPNNDLRISYLELYNANGSRFRYATNIDVPSSWTYNLDTLRQGGGRWADIWWHVVSDGVGFLERSSSARTARVWNL